MFLFFYSIYNKHLKIIIMGRKKIENKKKNLVLNIDINLYEKVESLDIKNKSKFISWLLEEHFNSLKYGGN